MSTPPTFDIPAQDEVLIAALERLRLGALAHPIAARAIFAALVEEGRRFAATQEGAATADSLSRSPSFARARHVWNATTGWLTEGAAAGAPLPSTLIDSLLAVASRVDAASLLERSATGGRER